MSESTYTLVFREVDKNRWVWRRTSTNCELYAHIFVVTPFKLTRDVEGTGMLSRVILYDPTVSQLFIHDVFNMAPNDKLPHRNAPARAC